MSLFSDTKNTLLYSAINFGRLMDDSRQFRSFSLSSFHFWFMRYTIRFIPNSENAIELCPSQELGTHDCTEQQ